MILPLVPVAIMTGTVKLSASTTVAVNSRPLSRLASAPVSPEKVTLTSLDKPWAGAVMIVTVTAPTEALNVTV